MRFFSYLCAAKTTLINLKMRKNVVTVLMMLLALFSCSEHEEQGKEGFDIYGPWVLVSLTAPDGTTKEMDFSNYTRCKIYTPDSTYYSVQLKVMGSETIVIPHELAQYTLKVTPDDTLYIENNRVTRFQIINDSTMTTVWGDMLETWRHVTDMTESRKEEICNIVRSHQNNEGEILKEYVLSISERELKSTINTYHYLFIILVLVVMLALGFILSIIRRKREVERHLQAIIDEQNTRPVVVADAMKQVEEDFFHSDYYYALNRRIEAGENMDKADWDELECHLNAVYTNFTYKLYSLYTLSDTEFHVCMLLKLRVPNKQIAAVIKLAPDSVSSIRSRLHKKVLGPGGGAKEWDEFIFKL